VAVAASPLEQSHRNARASALTLRPWGSLRPEAEGVGKHRFWSEWIQAGSLYYFRPWRVATGPWRCFPRDLQSPLDAQESNVA
jgi:hypothetical protein